MNSTGCSAGWARDELFDFGRTPSSAVPCTFSTPLWAVLLSIYGLILLAVAFSRTQYIIKRVYARKNQSSRGGFTCCGQFAWLQIVTLSVSWVSAINCVFILVWPLTYGPEDNVIVVLLGIQYLAYGIIAERWLTKLIRLGTRIIGPGSTGIAKKTSKALSADVIAADEGGVRTSSRAVVAGDSREMGSDDNEMSDLNRFDTVLVVLMTVVRVLTLLQFIFTAIIPMVLPNPVEARKWFLAGIGLIGAILVASWIVSMYQYERCKKAIVASQKRVQDLRGGGANERPAYETVLKKFTRHQITLTCLGGIGLLVHVLWAVEVFPINFTLVLVAVFFDAMTNGIMLATFVRKTTQRVRRKFSTKPRQHNNDGPKDALGAEVANKHRSMPFDGSASFKSNKTTILTTAGTMTESSHHDT